MVYLQYYCDPCLSALRLHIVYMALYEYSSFHFLYQLCTLNVMRINGQLFITMFGFLLTIAW